MSFIMRMKAFIELLRPVNCLLAAFGTFIGYTIAMHSINFSANAFNLIAFNILNSYSLIIAMLVTFIICGAGQAINDFFDLEIDKRKKNARKPIIAYNLKPKNVLAFSLFLFAIGSTIAFFLGTIPFLIAVGFSLLLILYSAFFSKIKYIGNWVVALGTAFTLVFGASLIGNYEIVFFFALAALFANVSRELIKDLEDKKVDAGFKESLPMLFSENKIVLLIALLYIAAIISVLIPFFSGKTNIFFFAMILFSALVFKMSLMSAFHKYYGLGQKYAKIGMLIALIAFLISVF